MKIEWLKKELSASANVKRLWSIKAILSEYSPTMRTSGSQLSSYYFQPAVKSVENWRLIQPIGQQFL
jgi:hypothetical protein